MNWRKVGRGVVGAAINSIANSIVLIVIDPTTFNLFQGGATKLAQAAIVSGLLGAALWIKQHPVTWDEFVSRGEVR